MVHFNLEIEIKNNSIIIIYINNNIFIEDLPKLKYIIKNSINKNINKIILNLQNCKFIEKNIWEYFINLKKELLINNGDIVITNISSNLEKDYNILEIYNNILLYQDIKDAIYSI